MNADKIDKFLREKSSPRKLALNLNSMTFSEIPLTEVETKIIYLFEFLKRKYLKGEFEEIKKIVKERFNDDKFFLIAVKEFSELPICEYPTELVIEVIKIKGELRKLNIDTSDIKKIIEEDRFRRMSLRMTEDKLVNNQFKLNKSEFLEIVDEYDIKEIESWKSIMILLVQLSELLKL